MSSNPGYMLSPTIFPFFILAQNFKISVIFYFHTFCVINSETGHLLSINLACLTVTQIYSMFVMFSPDLHTIE